MKLLFKLINVITILLIVNFIFSTESAEARRVIPDNNLRYPIHVTLGDGSKGSGFYFRHDNRVYFVTARHVLFEKDKNNFILISTKADLLSYSPDLAIDDPTEIELNLDKLNNNGLIKYDKFHDVAIVKIAENNNYIDGVTLKTIGGAIISASTKFMKKFDEVLIGNNVYIFGYPTSLGIKQLPQIDYKRPLLRKGIIAGVNKKKQTIIIDAPTYFGNSGGPVIEAEQVDALNYRFCVIGLVSEIVPFAEEWINKQYRFSNLQIENSGYSVVVPMDKILELMNN
ncbi:serine protease [Candidatus Omnitrophota bacterium]